MGPRVFFRAFARVTRDEVPQEWWGAEKRAPHPKVREDLNLPPGAEVQTSVVIDLPDYEICRQWLCWYRSQPVRADTVGAMISSREQWSDREADVQAIFDRFQAEGKPKVFPVLCFTRKQ